MGLGYAYSNNKKNEDIAFQNIFLIQRQLLDLDPFCDNYTVPTIAVFTSAHSN